ncbi:MAG: hypothetical protein ACJAY5_001533 [Actinomycetes bacterium]|jgi:hypothetical protein
MYIVLGALILQWESDTILLFLAAPVLGTISHVEKICDVGRAHRMS